MTGGRALRGGVLLAVGACLVVPILAGLVTTGRAAFGVLPAIGAVDAGLDPWRALIAQPGFASSLRLTLVTGFAATALSVLLAAAAVAVLHRRVRAEWLAPFLAVPHAALAIGLAFLLAPSGWIARGLAPLLGWSVPPDVATVNDPSGVALILGLMAKEVPFLILMLLAALSQIPARTHIAAARALGYGPGVVWVSVILPQLWPLLRLPVRVVLAFSLSVVDVALILGPLNPPTLAVAVTRWFAAPDAALLLPASAGAILQAAVVAGGIAILWGIEQAAAAAGRLWLRRGGRGRTGEPMVALLAAMAAVLAALSVAALIVLAVWSLAFRWPWPAMLPQGWTLRFWMTPGDWWSAAGQTLAIGGTATIAALILAIAWLEGEDRGGHPRARWGEALIYLPLMLPQVAFLFGLNVELLRLGISPGFWAVVWGHVLFVFPYVMIALSDPWRRLDPGHLRSAAALGAGPMRRLVAIKLPLLLRPILIAAAVGFSVSVALYLPTLFLGGGRIATLTTEAVTLSSGADRRVLGVLATLQAVLPVLAFATAGLVPRLLHRNRLGMTGGIVA
ncbi:MAG: ABC transporter permease subunit [Paracoccaceae bacterium]|nr:MAG: ABC transporter permease subunit [Paracoccaceae bacterium]